MNRIKFWGIAGLISVLLSGCSDGSGSSSNRQCGVPVGELVPDDAESSVLSVILKEAVPEDGNWAERANYGCVVDDKRESCSEYQDYLKNARCPESFLCLKHSLENQHYCMERCPEGLSACDGRCVDGRTNNSYCGANEDCSSFTVCSGNQSCYGGRCINVSSNNCEEGDKSCISDGIVRACLDGTWVTVDCSRMDMNCISGQCVSLGKECDDSQAPDCLDDGKTVVSCQDGYLHHRECGKTQKCVDGNCIDVVVEGESTDIGCADGEREGFLDVVKYRNIAACSGAWSVPGIFDGANAPSCSREAGDDGSNPQGTGCNIQDLCADGWHVCTGRNDVTERTGEQGCTEIMRGTEDENGDEPPAFFLTREQTGGALRCHGDYAGLGKFTEDGSGCGNLGCPVDNADRGCSPLNRGLHNLCSGINTVSCSCSRSNDTIVCSGSPCSWCRTLGWYRFRDGKDYVSSWNCGRDSVHEAQNITKTAPDLGGVLCCRDTLVTTD